jgi:hypothetical protein
MDSLREYMVVVLDEVESTAHANFVDPRFLN